MGSTSVPQGDAPQQEFPVPATTRRAASPYFSLTTSLMLSVLMIFSCVGVNHSGQRAVVLQLGCGYSTRHTRILAVLPMPRYWPCSAETCLRAVCRPSLHS